jgi:pyrroline-5-carboxylate reductase
MIGLVGSGNMARALALGWGEPVLCTDALPEKAEALAAETGARRSPATASWPTAPTSSSSRTSRRSSTRSPSRSAGARRASSRSSGPTPLADVKAAYGETPVVRIMPSVPVEVGHGVSCHARDPDADGDLERRALELFGKVGPVVTLDEGQIDAAMGLMSCAPAYWALVVEAQVDAGIRAGVPGDVAAQLVVGTMAGTAKLIDARDNDTLAVKRQVMSPGGSTARGLAALEAGGVRGAFDDAMQAVVRR